MSTRIKLRDSGRMVLVEGENGAPRLVTEFEARMELLRFAESLRPGSQEQAHWTDKALNGELPECPPEIAAQFGEVA